MISIRKTGGRGAKPYRPSTPPRNVRRKIRGKMEALRRRQRLRRDGKATRTIGPVVKPIEKRFYLPTLKQMAKSPMARGALSGIHNKLSKADSDGALAYARTLGQKTAVSGKRAGVSYSAGTSPALNSPSRNDEKELPYIAATTVSMKSQSGLDKSDKRKIKTNIVSGQPSARAIKMQERLGGALISKGMDTKMPEDVSENLIPARASLENRVGFNRRHVWIMPMGSVFSTQNILTDAHEVDYTNVAAFNTREADVRAKDKAYIGVQWIKSQLSFMNKNAFLPINIRLNVIGFKDRPDVAEEGVQSRAFAETVFNTNIDDVNQEVRSIPVRYQASTLTAKEIFADPREDAIANSYEVECSNKYTMKSSPGFRRAYEVITSCTKRLEPNDQWLIDHTHHMGPGLEYYTAKNLIVDGAPGGDASISYFYVVESWGVPVQAEVADGITPTVTTDTFQGTSPGGYHCEYKTSAKYSLTTANEFRTAVGGISPQVLIRTFKKRDYDNTPQARERSIAFADIVPTAADVTAVGQAYVPLLTDLSVTGAQQRSST